MAKYFQISAIKGPVGPSLFCVVRMRGLELKYVHDQSCYEGGFRKEHTMMKKKVIGFLAILMVIIAPALLVAGQPQNVILFGWDGAQRDHVNECLARHELPNLQKLIDSGKYVQIDVEGKTDTKAGWSQILTGYYPEVTGVYSNGIYQPIPKGLSLFERLEKHFGSDNFVTVAVIGKRAHCGEIDPPKKITGRC